MGVGWRSGLWGIQVGYERNFGCRGDVGDVNQE